VIGLMLVVTVLFKLPQDTICLIVGLSVLGCICYTGRESLAIWLQENLNWSVSNTTAAVLIFLLLAMALLILYLLRHFKFIWMLARSIFFVFLTTAAIKLLAIEGNDLSNTELCCGEEDPIAECPVLFDAGYWTAFILLFLFHLITIYLWYRYRKRKKELKVLKKAKKLKLKSKEKLRRTEEEKAKEEEHLVKVIEASEEEVEIED